jgi:sulfur carrier protein|tara:strand:+ start:2568 stop:2798 length:231 start_codon:yes stop_codon:yes gene_type:complete
MSDQVESSGPVQVVVNGEGTSLPGLTTVAGLCREISAEVDRVAVMVNGQIVPRARFEKLRLNDGDEIEIVTYAAGG